MESSDIIQIILRDMWLDYLDEDCTVFDYLLEQINENPDSERSAPGISGCTDQE